MKKYYMYSHNFYKYLIKEFPNYGESWKLLACENALLYGIFRKLWLLSMGYQHWFLTLKKHAVPFFYLFFIIKHFDWLWPSVIQLFRFRLYKQKGPRTIEMVQGVGGGCDIDHIGIELWVIHLIMRYILHIKFFLSWA